MILIKEIHIKEKNKNRVIHDLIEPGSTIKPLIIYAALENNVINQSTVIDTAPGFIELDGIAVKDWTYLGKVSPGEIIKLSSNIGAAKVSSKLTKKQLISNLDNFGLGQSLFINLPGAQIGSIPSPNELKESEHLSIGYGYGLSVSLMHLANAYTTLANYGAHTQLTYVIDKGADLVDKKQILNRGTSSVILDMMREVVHAEDGTGKKARVNGYTVYGKTGTVRKIKNGKYNKNSHNALFVGILGDPSPKYVAAVIIREPKDREGSGGYHAAPIFGEFLQHSMRILDNKKNAAEY